MEVLNVKKVVFNDTDNTVIATITINEKEHEGKFAHHRIIKRKLSLVEFKEVLRTKKID